LIEKQPEESRESTPADDDESDDPENQSEPSVPEVDMDEPANVLMQLSSLKPKTPNPRDRKSTTFLVCDNIHQYVLNSSFGLISTYSGQFGLFLRRGASAQKVRFIF
jgi:hypothetical protein